MCHKLNGLCVHLKINVFKFGEKQTCFKGYVIQRHITVVAQQGEVIGQ